MLLLWSFLVLFILTAAVLLFMPLVVRIDSSEGVCSARWGPASADLRVNEEVWRYRVHAPFFHREGPVNFDPTDRQARKGDHTRKVGHTDRKRSARRVDRSQLVERVIASFRVRRFQWYLDTGDPVWNAWLFPLFHLWRMRGVDVRIVFDGRQGLHLDLRNNAFRLMRAVLLSTFHQPQTTRP